MKFQRPYAMSFSQPSTMRSLYCSLIACIGIAVIGSIESAYGQAVDVSATPPTVSIQVKPNIILTFDDSGSMTSTYMGDLRPYDNGTWNGPWVCANAIDPRAAATDPKSNAMNGVYYNPNIIYTPPLKEDGTAFIPADATLASVWQDGIAVNRPVGAVSATASGLNNNPSGSSGANSGAQTNLMGTGNNRWQCSSAWGATATVKNPFDGTFADPDTGAKPIAGPVYWRFKSSVTFAPADIGTLGQFTATGLTKLYNAANWEAVSVPSSQYQNFANWYAYYRYRNLMARTAMSRVFGVIGSPTKSPIRVLWQNINNSTYGGGSSSVTGLNGKTITNLDDSTLDPYSSGKNYREAFFNWLYQVGASGSTPTRTAEVRAGNFLCNGLNSNCNPNASATTTNSTNPYWSGGAGGQELACRQNYHMMMTDGLYNSPNVSITGNGSNTTAATTLPLSPPRLVTNPSAYAPGTGASPTTLFNHPTWTKDADNGSSYSDIAFYYWANNLRADLAASHPGVMVPTYFPDLTTGVTGPTTTIDPTDLGAIPEVFWNPVNDPATWPHLVQFPVTLGAFGNLNQSNDVDCNLDDGFGVGNDDLCKLRKGLANSTGSVGWQQPNGGGGGVPANIDDLWHAALNSRGQFFVATDPESLVSHLRDILNNIAARSSSSTASTTNTGVLSQGSLSYKSGFYTGDWVGSLTAFTLDASTGAASLLGNWDAGCLLTAPPCKIPNLVTTSTQTGPPATRQILTASGVGQGVGKPFQWTSLSPSQQTSLNLDATPAVPVADANGQFRLNYLRGDQSHEASGATPLFRKRSSVLGAVINSQPMYVSFPDSGFNDDFPSGSPEAAAAALLITDAAGATTEPTVDGTTYEQFVKNHRMRQPTLYVGANDGMLHAFNANTGAELFGFVPSTVFSNLNRFMLNTNFSYTNYVDNTPIHRDVFSTIDNKWHTILVGTLRLGGRGVFALDITNPTTVNESTAASSVLWEYNSTSPSGGDLGYTFGLPNIARTPAGWVVLVPSGNFPNCPGTPVIPNCMTSSNKFSSFYVLNAMTGAFIAEIKTPSGINSYGLSSITVGGSQGTEIETAAFAGDLVGNMFRLNMSDPIPANWTVDVIFKTYTGSGNCPVTPITGGPCSQPITSAPTLFPSALNSNGYMVVFGTGQYLSPADATTTLTQAFYGISDAGAVTASPVLASDLVSQTLKVTGAAGLRELTNNAVASPKKGWIIALAPIAGERVLVSPGALFSINGAILGTFSPSVDPCSTTSSGGILIVNSQTGGPIVPNLYAGGSGTAGYTVVGQTVINAPATGSLPLVQQSGGGGIVLPGIIGANNNQTIKLPAPIWRRRAWRMLFNDL